MLVFFFNRRTPYVMKDFLHNESCLEKYYACWQGSLISMVYFDKLTYFFGDNLSFRFAFQCDRQFWQMHFTSHIDKIFIFQTKMWTPKHYCFFWVIFFHFFMWSLPDFKNKFQIIRLLQHVQAGKQNIKGCLNFLKISCLVYSQIWVYLLIHDSQFDHVIKLNAFDMLCNA